MHVLMLSNDLMFTSQVELLVAAHQAALVVCGTEDALLDRLEAQPPPEPPQGVLLDLSTPGVAAGRVVEAVRSLTPAACEVVAYAPHVHEQKLVAAKAAGCDAVLTRGRLHAGLPDLIARWAQR